MQDFLGREILPQTWVVYSANGGRSAILKIGLVVEIVPKKDVETRYGYIEHKDPYLRVITADRWFGGNLRHYPDGWQLQNDGKPIRLTMPERLVIIEDVPEIVRLLFDGKISPTNVDGEIVYRD